MKLAEALVIAALIGGSLLVCKHAIPWLLEGAMEPRYSETSGRCIKNCLGAPEYPE